MITLYFDESEFSNTTDIVNFKIYKSASFAGTFVLLTDCPYNPHKNYVEIDLAEANDTDWYKMSYVDSSGEESELSSAFLGENVSAIIDVVREGIRDTGEGPGASSSLKYAFSDDELLLKIRSSLKRFKKTESLGNLEQSEIGILVILVKISCCYDLAYDYGKQSKISLPSGGSVTKQEQADYYIRLAGALEAQYKNMMSDWTTDDDSVMGTPSIEVLESTRQSYFVNPVRRRLL